jgi:metal-responsive CopG/Arc/MetJ family transcriptional regulator
MRRTQIQLPDVLYNRLKTLAKNEETSLAEIIRRAAEYMLLIHPDWNPPEPEDLGEFRSHESDWRILANE